MARSAAGSCDRASRGDTPTTSGICLVARYASTFAGSADHRADSRAKGGASRFVDAHEVPNKPHVVVHEGRMLRKQASLARRPKVQPYSASTLAPDHANQIYVRRITRLISTPNVLAPDLGIALS